MGSKARKKVIGKYSAIANKGSFPWWFVHLEKKYNSDFAPPRLCEKNSS